MRGKHLVIVLLLLVICGSAVVILAGKRSPRAYAFEAKPRPVLAELGVSPSSSGTLAVAANGTLYLLAVYGDEQHRRLGLTMSHDGGDSFTPLVPVSAAEARVSAHGESTPVLIQLPTAVYAVWQQTQSGQSQIRFARAKGMGHEFEPPVLVTQKTQPSFNGFPAAGVAPNGDIYIVWLDGRDAAAPEGTFAVYMAKSTDKGVTFSPNVRLARGACPCCRPDIAFGANGEVFVAWRQVSQGNVRDIVVATSHSPGESFSEPVKVADDHWSINACPDSGPSMIVDKGRLFVAWYTEAAGSPQVRLATSTDHGASFFAPVRASADVLDPNHPVLRRSSDGQMVLAFQGRPRNPNGDSWLPMRSYLASVQSDGSAGEPRPVPGSRSSSTHPEIALAGGGRIYMAWAQPGQGTALVLSRGRQE